MNPILEWYKNESSVECQFFLPDHESVHLKQGNKTVTSNPRTFRYVQFLWGVFDIGVWYDANFTVWWCAWKYWRSSLENIDLFM